MDSGNKYNLFGSTAWLVAPHLTRIQVAEAARYTVMAIAYGMTPTKISPTLSKIIER